MITALILFLFPLAYSPGPGNLFFAAQGARFGFGAALRALIGYHAATFVVTLLIGLGALTAAAVTPGVFQALRIIGAGYVLWLAIKLLSAGVLRDAPDARPAGLGDGAMLLLLNPKAYAIIALMFSQFIGQSTLGGAREALLITTIFTANNLIAFCLWTLLGAQLAGLFKGHGSARVLNSLFGGLLAGVAVWMLWL